MKPIYYIGDVVWYAFPNSDLSEAKVRPAIVLLTFPRGDLLTAMITSKLVVAPTSLPIPIEELTTAGLFKSGMIKTSRLFTVSRSVLVKPSGRFSEAFTTRVRIMAARMIFGLSE